MKLGGSIGNITSKIKKWARKIFIDWFIAGAVFISLYQNNYRLDFSLIPATVGNYGTIVAEVFNKITMAREYLAAVKF